MKIELPGIGGKWELLSGDLSAVDTRDVRILVRVKEPAPLPQILAGDVIRYDGQDRVVFKDADEDGRIRYVDTDTRLFNSWSTKYFAKHPFAEVYRNGQLIWSKNK